MKLYELNRHELIVNEQCYVEERYSSKSIQSSMIESDSDPDEQVLPTNVIREPVSKVQEVPKPQDLAPTSVIDAKMAS